MGWVVRDFAKERKLAAGAVSDRATAAASATAAFAMLVVVVASWARIAVMAASFNK